MKKIIMGILALASFSIYAQQNTIDNIGNFTVTTKEEIRFEPNQIKTNFFKNCNLVLSHPFATKKKISSNTYLQTGKPELVAPSSGNGVWFKIIIPILNKEEIKSITCRLQSSGWLSQDFSRAPTIADFLDNMEDNFEVRINNSHDELK